MAKRGYRHRNEARCQSPFFAIGGDGERRRYTPKASLGGGARKFTRESEYGLGVFVFGLFIEKISNEYSKIN